MQTDNQWPVNFNYELTSFEPHIRGVRHLIDFSLNSERAASLFFISTVSTVSHLTPNCAVPEAPNNVLTTALGGYGSSKQVCELILQDASEKSGVDPVVCRVGQIAGPVLSAEKGMWAKQEWIPTVCYPQTPTWKSFALTVCTYRSLPVLNTLACCPRPWVRWTKWKTCSHSLQVHRPVRQSSVMGRMGGCVAELGARCHGSEFETEPCREVARLLSVR